MVPDPGGDGDGGADGSDERGRPRGEADARNDSRGGSGGRGRNDVPGESGDQGSTPGEALGAVFEAARAGEGPHSLYGTLAPVYELMMRGADDHYDGLLSIVRAAVEADRGSIDGGREATHGTGADAGRPDSVLEIAPGTGGLLGRLAGRYPRVVGLEASPRLARIAARRGGVPVVVGDALRPPIRGEFDAVVGLEYPIAGLTGEGDPERFLGTVGDLLAPGGTAVVDAPAEPRAVLDDPWRGSVAGYRVDRTVAAGDLDGNRAEVAVEYEIADSTAGETVETVDHLTLRLFDEGELRALLREAGLTDVRVSPRPDDPGGLVAVGRRPP